MADGRHALRSSPPWQQLRVQLVDPVLVAEVTIDVSSGMSGHGQHLFCLVRLRADLAPTDTRSSAIKTSQTYREVVVSPPFAALAARQ